MSDDRETTLYWVFQIIVWVLLVVLPVINLGMLWRNARMYRQWRALVRLHIDIVVRIWIMRRVLPSVFLPPGYVVTAKVATREEAMDDDE